MPMFLSKISILSLSLSLYFIKDTLGYIPSIHFYTSSTSYPFQPSVTNRSFKLTNPTSFISQNRHRRLNQQNFKSLTSLLHTKIRVWTEDAEDGFVDDEENLEEGEICLLAVKAFASSSLDNNPFHDENTDDDASCISSMDGATLTSAKNLGRKTSTKSKSKHEENKRFLCAGALVQRPQKLPSQSLSNNTNEISSNQTIETNQQESLSQTTKRVIVCDAWMEDAIMENGQGGPNLQIQGAMQVLDHLFCHFLQLQHESRRTKRATAIGSSTPLSCTWHFVVQCGGGEDEYTCASYRAALSRGFVPINCDTIGNANDGYNWEDGFVFDYGIGIQRYTTTALEMRGTPMGNKALEILSYLSSQRISYPSQGRKGNYFIRGEEMKIRGKISEYTNFLPSAVSSKILNLALDIDQNYSGFCKDLDSVDGMPSLHLPLVAEGKSLVGSSNNMNDNADSSNNGDLFDGKALEILELIQPYVDTILLPAICELTDSSSVKVSDIFLRRYGKQLQSGDERNDGISAKNPNDSTTRFGIPAHYDVYNMATAVVALDDSSRNGEDGLYTILSGPNGEGGTNHAALRRYFPLCAGDAVLHTWDVQHGVDIRSDMSRTSLVIWFTEEKGEDEKSPLADAGNKSNSSMYLPWLSIRKDSDDDVRNFVLASAFESMGFDSTMDDNMYEIHDGRLSSDESIRLNVKSASSGNTNALTYLGNICKENELKPCQILDIITLLDQIMNPTSNTKDFSLDPLVDLNLREEKGQYDSYSFSIENDAIQAEGIARRLWYEAAKSGNYLSQTALADECMELSNETGITTLDESSFSELDILSSVLYALAGQQGYKDARIPLFQFLKHHGVSDKKYNLSNSSFLALASENDVSCNNSSVIKEIVQSAFIATST